jgi:WD40 repeat protein
MSRLTLAVLPAALLLSAGALVPAVSVAQAAGASHSRAPAASHTAAVPGQQLWVQRYQGPGKPFNGTWDAALSPDGTTVFVTGSSWSSDPQNVYRQNYATIAYRAATGARLWVARYSGPGLNGVARSMAVSPNGKMVFVTGASKGTSSEFDYATVAYQAATGAQLWVKRYNGPGNGDDEAVAVAVSPDGGKVFVTGSSEGTSSGLDYATVAYRASTGARLWAKRYNGPGNGDDSAASLAVSPNGQMVAVTGQSPGAGGRNDYQTIAYNATTGAQLWGSRYNGPADSTDDADAVTVSPDSTTVVVTGPSYGDASTDFDWATVAYRATTGAQLWATRHNGPGNDLDQPWAMAMDPTGTRVFVTGFSTGKTSEDCTTIAYRTTTGAQLWATGYNGPANGQDNATDITTSPDGTKVFITGSTGGQGGGPPPPDYITIGYNAATGAHLWASRYNGPANGIDLARSVVASATRVIVTGVADITESTGHSDYTTIAYKP